MNLSHKRTTRLFVTTSLPHTSRTCEVEGWRVARLHVPCLHYSKSMLPLYLTQIVLHHCILPYHDMRVSILITSWLETFALFHEERAYRTLVNLSLMTLKSLSSKISWWGEGVAEVGVALLWQLLGSIYIHVTKRTWIRNSWSVHCPSHVPCICNTSNIVAGNW